MMVLIAGGSAPDLDTPCQGTSLEEKRRQRKRLPDEQKRDSRTSRKETAEKETPGQQQTQSPTPACKQSTSGCLADACPTCRVMPDDPSFCMRLSNIRIHQALALPGAPCAQGATEDESAYLFAETTWKMACAAVSPPVRYEDHVPEYLAQWSVAKASVHSAKSPHQGIGIAHFYEQG